MALRIARIRLALTSLLICGLALAAAPAVGQQVRAAKPRRSLEPAAKTVTPASSQRLRELEPSGIKVPTSVAMRVSRMVTLPATGPTPMLLASGYDSLRSEPRGICMAVTAPATVIGAAGAGGQNVSYDARELTSMSSLESALGLSAQASFGFGVYSGDVKASYYRSVAMNSYSTYMAVHTTVINQVESLTRYHLLDDAVALLKADPKKFYDRCGDMFVVARQTGGDYLGIVEFSTQSQSEKEQISASIRATGLGWNAGADVTSVAKQFSGFSSTVQRLFRNGGVGNVPSMDQMLAQGRSFPQEVKPAGGQPVAIALIALDYGVVDNIPFDAKLVDLARSRRVIEQLASERARTQALRGDVDYVLTHADDFEGDTAALNSTRAQLDAVIAAIDAAASSCLLDPSACAIPALQTPPVVIPPFKIKTLVAVHRSFSPTIGHFYTTNLKESDWCCGLTREAANYFYLREQSSAGTVPFYRCIWSNSKHYYSQSSACEAAPGARSEGFIGFIATSALPGTIPLFRLYHGPTGDHLYTTDPNETQGFTREGIAGYVWPRR